MDVERYLGSSTRAGQLAVAAFLGFSASLFAATPPSGLGDATDGVCLSTDFERGSLGPIRRVADGRYLGQTMHWIKADRVGDQYYWFYFQVEGAKGRRLDFEFTNLIGVYRGRPHEVYTTSTRPVVTYDGERWERIDDVAYDKESLAYSFRHEFRADWARVAYAHPYPPSRAEKLVDRLRENEAVRAEVVALSRQGRPLTMLSLTGESEATGDRSAAVSETAKRSALILAGQHAGEDAAPHAVEGLLDFLASDDPLAAQTLAAVDFHVVPLMNPDGFFHGTTRYTWSMEDLNAEWDDDSSDPDNLPVEPEVLGVKDWIDGRYQSGGRLDMLLDVHCYGQRQPRITLQTPENVLAPFCESVRTYFPIVCKPKNKPGSARWYVLERYGVPAGTLEITQSRLGDGPYLDIPDYHRLGRDLALAIGDYYR